MDTELVETTEETFLNHVSKCLGRSEPLNSQPQRIEIGPPAFWKEQENEKDKILDLFKSNLEALSGRVFIAKDPNDAKDKLAQWVKELDAKLIVCWDHPELSEIVDADYLGINVQKWNDEKDSKSLIEIAAKAEIGVTWVDYAIGYTGTMAIFSRPKHGRSISLLPPTHIGIFKRSNLVPTMSKVIEKVKIFHNEDKNKIPSAINFITGPSRTSDIEMDLSIGVHGPYRTWVIIIED